MDFKKEEKAISVVIPIWNEIEENIKELYSRLTYVLVGLGRAYEIIFVDNRSNNEIFNTLFALHKKDERVKIIRLAKNFGQRAAFLAGFEYARGEIIVTMDSDLQNSPEDLPKFIEKMDAGFQVAFGWRTKRRDPLFTRRIPSFLLNRIINIRTGVNLHDWGCSFNAIKKKTAEQLESYGTTARFIKPIALQITTSIVEIPVKHCDRKRGKSSYNISSLMLMALDSLMHYSTQPTGKYGSLFVVSEIY